MQHPSRLLVALLAAFAGACEKPAPAAYQPPLVTITKPVVRDVTREQVFIGETRPAQTAEVRSGGSYASQSDLRLQFGLGDATSVDRAAVRWPDGSESTFEALAVRRVHVLSPR